MLTIKDAQGKTVGILKDGDTEPDMIDTIKKALSRAKAGDEILVPEGEYTEQVTEKEGE